MSDWRPMFTAPRDPREKVLLAFGGKGVARKVLIAWWRPAAMDRLPSCWTTSDRIVQESECLGWMYLPEPPKEPV